MDTETLAEFQVATAGRDSDVDLFGAAMLIARLGGGSPDPHATARELDLIAECVREATGPTLDPETLAHAIDQELFVVRGFHGNTSEYSEPENSFLDRVIERRTGIPISMSLVYMEVAQRVGLRCDGIGYPGHFIVRCGEPGAPLYIDPFNQGIRLDREELLANLRGLDLGGASADSFLAAISRRQLLQRMLRNLHLVYRERREVLQWLDVVDLSIALEPWNSALVGERGMLNYRLGRHSQAYADLQRYTAAAEPDTLSAGAVRLLDELRLRLGGLEELR